MNQKRFYVLFVLAFTCCTTAFPQHPYSHGGNPLYWAIVGAISAAIIYIFYWGIYYLRDLVKRKKNRIADSDEMEKYNAPNSIESEQKNENDDISSSIYYEDKFIEGKLQDNDSSSKTDIPSFSSKLRRLFLGSISDSGVRKRIIFAIFVYAILLLISVGIIEPYIYEKTNQLHSDLIEEMKRPFDNIGKQFVSTYYLNQNDVELIETPIPPLKLFNKNDEYFKTLDKKTKRQWSNMFSETDHLYRIADGGWSIWCYTYLGDVGSSRGIIDLGHYMPYMISVPKGVEFNTQIAENILNRALSFEKLSQINEYNDVEDALSYLHHSNEYYQIHVNYNHNDSVPTFYDVPYIECIPFDVETTGTDPIYDENGKFTGYYLFGMQIIDSYKILFGYKKKCAFNVSEYYVFGDFNNGALQDRVLYYGLVFTFLTSILALYLLRITRKLKANKLIITESLKDRVLRYADPVNFLKKPQPRTVAIARDVCEKLLDPNTDYSQVEEVADEFKENTGINLITEQEKAYLLGICSRIKNKNKQRETIRLVNNLYVLLADTSKVGGKEYTDIQRTVAVLLNINKWK